jgi:excisionase family DNA binding protein
VGVAREDIVEETKGNSPFPESIVISKTHQNGEGDNTMTEETREELLTVREVARRLRVDDTTVRRWIKSGALEAITLPHRGKRQAYRIKRSTLDRLLNSSIQLS